MLGYWIFNKAGTVRNYGNINYGSALKNSGSVLLSEPISISGEFYYSFSAKNVSGKILEQDNFSFGLMKLKNGVIPYVKHGNNLYKPDNRFASDSENNWGIHYKSEQFADKDFTLSIYRGNENIYTYGVDSIRLNDNIYIYNTGINELKLYDSLPINPVSSPNFFNLFGSGGSGTLGSGIPLILGGPFISISSGMNLSMYSTSAGCYLLDESGNILYDEFNDPLYSETCSNPYIGLIAGFDMYISGNNSLEFILPLYLRQTDTTYSLGSSLPLSLQAGGHPIGKTINLTAYNTYSSVTSGMMLSITASGINDGYIPIGSGFPLYIHRNENVSIDLFISGAATTVSGNMNLYLNGNTYPTSGTMNLSMPYTYDIPNSGMYLYTAGY